MSIPKQLERQLVRSKQKKKRLRLQKEDLERARIYLHQEKQFDKLETEICQDNPDLNRINWILYGNREGVA